MGMREDDLSILIFSERCNRQVQTAEYNPRNLFGQLFHSKIIFPLSAFCKPYRGWGMRQSGTSYGFIGQAFPRGSQIGLYCRGVGGMKRPAGLRPGIRGRLKGGHNIEPFARGGLFIYLFTQLDSFRDILEAEIARDPRTRSEMI